MQYSQSPFNEKWGDSVEKFGYTQVPNIAIRRLRELGLRPTDLSIFLYILSYPSGMYHAVSSISKSLGLYDTTIRTSLNKMERMMLIEKEFTIGEANVYLVDGWINRIQEYAISHHASPQELSIHPMRKLPRVSIQKLGNNKDKELNGQVAKSGPGYEKWVNEMNKRKQNRKNV